MYYSTISHYAILFKISYFVPNSLSLSVRNISVEGNASLPVLLANEFNFLLYRDDMSHLFTLYCAGRYQAQAVSPLGGMSTIPKLSINDRMSLNQADASYILSLECQTAIGQDF